MMKYKTGGMNNPNAEATVKPMKKGGAKMGKMGKMTMKKMGKKK